MATATDSLLPEVLRQLELGDADRSRLTALCAKLAPELSEIATRFFERLGAHAETGALRRGPEQIRRLHVTLVDWMRSGLLGPYDDEFYEQTCSRKPRSRPRTSTA